MITLNTSFMPKAKQAYNYAHNLYSKVKSTVLFKNSPKVNLGWYQNVGGELKEATLPLSIAKNMPSITKGLLFGALLALVVGSVHAKNKKIKNEQAVAANIQKAKEESEKEDVYEYDEKIPLPSYLAKLTKNPTTKGGRFYNSLKDNKEYLMADLEIDSEEYNRLAILSLKLAKEESSFGAGRKYKMYDKAHRNNNSLELLSDTRTASEAAKRGVHDIAYFDFSALGEDLKLREQDGVLSLGMTRFKINNASEDEKALFDKYGITYDNNKSNIVDPEQSAIATIIHLAQLKKLYPTYLKNADALKPDLNDPKVKKSIKNAQKILFNDQERPFAIEDLRTGRYNERGLDDKNVDDENIRGMGYYSKKDIEDLKIYARTVILSPEAHLIAMWNGRGVVPDPSKSRKALDETYINLLNIAAQKGYVANIDKKSQVIYD